MSVDFGRVALCFVVAFCVVIPWLDCEVSAIPVNLRRDGFGIPLSGSSGASSGLVDNGYKSPVSDQSDNDDFKAVATTQFLVRLLKEVALANQNSRTSRDNISELQHSLGMEEFDKRGHLQQKGDDPSGKRAGDRRCLYHAVNCW